MDPAPSRPTLVAPPIMIQCLRTALYPAPDLAAAKAWYQSVFQCEPYFDEPFYVGFAIGGFELGLVPDATPAAGGHGVKALWGVEQVAAELVRLAGLGIVPAEPVQDVGGGIKVVEVIDPFGNRLGLIENPHFDRAQVR